MEEINQSSLGLVDGSINNISITESGTKLVKKSVFEPGRTVVGVKFREYLDWVSNDAKFTSFVEVLKLPSIQRGFVWRPVKIVTLWDSLLRGMPFGSLLLNDMKPDEMVRGVDEKAAKELERVRKDEKVLGLLDGQQRTLAMKIGWPGEHQPTDHCIWIDLSEDGHRGAPFEFRITTNNQKFGFARDTHGRMGISDRRDANEEWLASLVGPPRDGVQPGDSLPRPWKGRLKDTTLTIRLSDLWSCYLTGTDKTGKCFHSLKPIREVLETPEHPQCKAIPTRLDRLAQRMGNLLSLEIPLVKLVGLEVAEHAPSTNAIKVNAAPEDASNDPLILLFQRISTAGERLSFEDLLFSMIKRSWPQAHDLVEKIHAGKVRHLLTAPGYVMLAFRLASIEYRLKTELLDGKNFSDIPEPGDSTFYSRLSHLLGNEKVPGPLRTYVSESSPLVQAFDFLYELLVFNDQTNPNGIPKLMMPILPPHLIHVLVYWVMQQEKEATFVTLKPSSEQLISFVLFWHLCVIDGARASQEALSHLASYPASRFPGGKLYEMLVMPAKDSEKAASMRMLYLPDEINSIFDFSNKGELRSMPDRIAKTTKETDADPRFQLFNIFWKKHTALLWIQRAYMSSRELFLEFDALAGKLDAETVPYDYDHICPQAEWRAIRSGDNLAELWKRDLTGDSIGNFHLLHASDNRGLGDASTSQKFVALETKYPDFFSKSAIDPTNRCLWESASPSPSVPVVPNQKYTWTSARIGAFQEAVDKRAMYLYSLYFDGLKCLLPPYQQGASISISIAPPAPLAEVIQCTQLDETPAESM